MARFSHAEWRKKNRHRIRKQRRRELGWAEGESDRAEALLPYVTSCAVCARTDPGSKKGWAADHDHRTGRFRAYVCHPCNIVLGYLERYARDPRFHAYLQAHSQASAIPRVANGVPRVSVS